MYFTKLKLKDISMKDRKSLSRMRSRYDKIMTDYLCDNRNDIFYFICKDKSSSIMGWATLEPYNDHWYYNIYIKPTKRRRGVATSLFDMAANTVVGDIFVRAPDDKSRNFFLKMSKKFLINIKFLE